MKKKTKKSLAETNRPLAQEWHPTRNDPFTPRDVTPGSSKKTFWWLCKNGHEWICSVAKRVSGEGCPYCSGHRVCKDNSLKTLNPDLARQWHPTKNAPLTPDDVRPGSHKKAWWVCKKGHEWNAQIKSRNAGCGCPYCSRHPMRKPTSEDCLAAVAPRIAREWHPTKNAPLTPKDVTSRSGKKVWWICSNGHEWEVQIAERANGGCPYCSGHRACKDNCLQTLNPGLAKQWHPSKNALLAPKDVTARSNKKVWWSCKKGHEWEARITLRARGGGCPYCAMRKADRSNCLKALRPDLARQWHPTKNVPLTPMDVVPGSSKKVWWLCKQGHEWNIPVFARNKGEGCPYCAGKRVCKENSLAAKGPWLAREWHSKKNGHWTPKDIAPFSTRLISWKCKNGHEHRERVIDRYRRGGCPVCTLKARAPRLFETA